MALPCVFSHAFKKRILRLMHKGCVLQHSSFDALSDITVHETKYNITGTSFMNHDACMLRYFDAQKKTFLC